MVGTEKIKELLQFCECNYLAQKDCRLQCKNCIECFCTRFSCMDCVNSIYNYNRVIDNSKRKFCNNRALCYVKNNLAKYCSELLSLMTAIKGREGKIEIASLGCGPATELYAIDYYIANHFPEKNVQVDYKGFDIDIDWKVIQDKNIELFQKDSNINVAFLHEDMFEYYRKNGNTPDFIIMNYMLSDMALFFNDRIKKFLDELCSFINNAPKEIWVLVNDTNLLNFYRKNEILFASDCFKYISEKLSNANIKIGYLYFSYPDKYNLPPKTWYKLSFPKLG